LQKEKHGDATRHGNGEAEDVDERNGFIRAQIAPREAEIGCKHGCWSSIFVKA
jgi:hypothetical protein